MDELTKLLAQVALLSGINYGLCEFLIKPPKTAYPDKAKNWWWLAYVPFVTGGLITWFSGINLLTSVVPTFNPLAGQVLTALVAGAGNEVLYSIFGRKPVVKEEVVE